MKRNKQLNIHPSLASADPLNLENEIKRLGDFPNLHFDIEDGNFIPNITFGINTFERVIDYTGGKKNLDVHLFVSNPGFWVDQVAVTAVKNIAIPIEALPNQVEVLQQIRSYGINAGVCLSFSTSADAILPYLTHIDYIIVMTAELDGMGTQFNPNMLKKIASLKSIIGDEKQIWADGGISKETVKSVYEAGATNVVLGRAIFGEEDPIKAAKDIKRLCEN